MNFDRAWIEAHIPQQGSMCLLDEVLSWDPQQVLCRSGTHRRQDHPLRAHDRLGSACAIEYAAQAAAVHEALLQSREPRAGARFGVLASARAVDLRVARLDQISGDLLVRAACLHSDQRGALYVFSVREERRDQAGVALPLAQGRLSLYLDALTPSTEHGAP